MKKFFFSLLWDCNENCLFCAKGKAPEGVKRRFSMSECAAMLRKKRLEGCDAVSLDGGEPTLLDYLPDVIRTASGLGYSQIHLLTNAVALSSPEKVAAIKRAPGPAGRLKRLGVCVSLHSHERRISETLTRSSGTFEKTVLGIRNLVSAGIHTTVYHLITSLNYRALPAFADFVINGLRGVGGVTFSHIYPASRKAENLRLYPRLSKVAPHLSRAAEKLRAKGLEVSMSNCGIIPVCLMGGCETLFTDTVIDNNISSETCDTSKTESLPFFMELFNKRNKTKPPSCAACALNPVCGGIWKFYAERRGTAELKPYSRKDMLGLPASGGTAALAFKKDPGWEDPASALLVRLLDLRYRGFDKAKIKGFKGEAAARTAAVRKFARNIGFSRITFH
ncbi:MAG: radical SAM protein [Elusimicrobia bacterium]|nr:radical SAM protein [Elusimicrobiota bacterium]